MHPFFLSSVHGDFLSDLRGVLSRLGRPWAPEASDHLVPRLGSWGNVMEWSLSQEKNSGMDQTVFEWLSEGLIKVSESIVSSCESCAHSLGLCLVLKVEGWEIYYLDGISLGARFYAFSFYLVRVSDLLCLGSVWFDLVSCVLFVALFMACCQGRSLTFLVRGLDFPLAGLQASC